MYVLGIILARAGSKGLPGKCMRHLLGRPLIAYTFDHALASRCLSAVVLSTDATQAKALAKRTGIEVIHRPAELADDHATVDGAARHAVIVWEDVHCQAVDAVALLYANIPVRDGALIDRAIQKLTETGADSVRSMVSVSKQHPDWLHTLDGDRLTQFRTNSIYRRQDLQPIYYHDGAVVLVTRASLFNAVNDPTNHQAFWGQDRRAIIQQSVDAVDVDEPADLVVAAALLESRLVPEAPTSHVIKLAQRSLGVQKKAFVIAEVGVNHDGQLAKAMSLIDHAVEAGADAVKFQIFRARTLVTHDAPTAHYQRHQKKTISQQDMLSHLELSQDDFHALKAHCDTRNIIFLATPFTEMDLSFLVTLGAPAIKLASTDFINRPLMDLAINTLTPLILSTGACTTEEMDDTVGYLRSRGALDRSIIMHCVSCYPTPLQAINLRAMGTLRDRYRCLVGLSDHTTSLDTGALAIAVGAVVVEKHVTLDSQSQGPDHATSLSPKDFQQYVTRLREAETALGHGQLGMIDMENDVRQVARKSLVSSKRVVAGQLLTHADVTFKRPGTGIAPQWLDKLIGRKARIDIEPDTLLAGEMFE